MTVLLPTSIANANWFLLMLWIPVAGIAALLHPKWRTLPMLQPVVQRRELRVYTLWTLLFCGSLFSVLAIALEVYYASGCPNSAVFQVEIEQLARLLYQVCAREQVPFWVMFGNLLFVLRGQNRIPVGDTDSDIAMQKRVFVDTFENIENFTQIVRRDAYLELQRVAYVNYISERELIQIYLNPELRGSHADIWLYKEEHDTATGKKWLVNRDRTIRAKRFPYEQVLPLADEPTSFLGVPVGMPQNATFLAHAEYGDSFMTPMVTRMECMENVWNGYTFYKADAQKRRYAALYVLVAAALTLAIAYGVPVLKQVLVEPRKMRRPWLETREKDFV